MSPLLLAFVFQQASLKDVHIHAAPLEKAIQKLSETYQSPMTVSNLIKDKVVFIEANQVSEEDVRDQIAKLVDASWEKKDSGWHLGQSTQQQGMMKQRRASIRRRFLGKTLEVRAKSQHTNANFNISFATQTYNQMANGNNGTFFGVGGAGYGSPEQRLMSRFLAKFDPNKISNVENGERAVFSTRPNAMQQTLGVSLNSEIAQYRSEYAIWKGVLDKFSKDSEGRVKGRQQTDGEDQDYLEDQDRTLMPQEVSDILFSVYTSEDGIGELALMFVSKDPKEAGLMVSASTIEGLMSTLKEEDFAQKQDPDFKLSPLATDFKNFLGRDLASIPKERLAQSLNTFADTMTRDPLSYGFSETLVHGAQKLKKNIVAILGDGSINVNEPGFSESYFEDRFLDIMGDVVAKEGNWIRMNALPFEGPAFPRADLKRIIARVRVNKTINLEDRAEIAALRPRIQRTSPIDGLIEAFIANDPDEDGDPDALRALGLLQQGEQARASSANGIAYGQLNPKLQRHLFECIYFNTRTHIFLNEDSKIPQNSFAAYEPTLLAPNGIPNNAKFKIDVEGEAMIRYPMPDEPNGFTMTARAWGETKFRLDNPKDFPGSDMKIDLNAQVYRMTMNTFSFRLLLNLDCEWTTEVHKIFRPDRATFTLNTLPPDLKEEFLEGYKDGVEELKMMKEMKKKGGGDGR